MKILLSLLSLSVSLYASSAEKLLIGKAIYEKTCISCHGSQGEGNPNMQLVVKPRKLNKTLLTQEQILKKVRKGAYYWGAHADIMPSFEMVYSNKETEAVALYVYDTFVSENTKNDIKTLLAEVKPVAEDKKAKMKKRASKIYKRNCIWCHGNKGHGDGSATLNPGLSVFPYDLSKTLLKKEQLFLYIKYGSHRWGTDKTDMPAWGNKYDDFTIHSLVKYIQEDLYEKR